MSISRLHTDTTKAYDLAKARCRRLCGAAVLLLMLCPTNGAAQGRSIPTSQDVAEQNVPEAPAPLPEGQKYRYPTLNGLSVSLNISDPVLELFKHEYANYEATATLDIHHRFLPQVTVGMGHCDETKTDGIRYHVRPTPYFKTGIAYNFQYNDVKPNDFYYVLLRYGFAASKSDVEHLTYRDGYWHDQHELSILDQKFRCHYLELGGGIRVQVHGRISLGWEVWYKRLLAYGSGHNGSPYYVPGFGTTENHLGFAFLATFDIF